KGDINRVDRRQLSFGQNLSQRPPVNELGGDEMNRVEIADLVNRDDVRVVQGAGGFGLLLEPEQPLIVFCALPGQEFERDLSFEPAFTGQIDFAHSAGAERRNDLVTVESCSDDDSHLENPKGVTLLERMETAEHAEKLEYAEGNRKGARSFRAPRPFPGLP